ncbi:copper amine oxidase N-terminal domain-containing protein [Saccharibacillus sp. CPCC 101409]|uniref:copper amine oxidase N-terminal domain-containing protein n=1 Tax=Saccharibacillus sp. CPCC 101409 TaxID=3058041 RepID=UPI0026719DEF|nr:copper amine oxidase N-terminal domain-containing protein [Saccharibacillus sp. CPCC 101409]MDO3408574.1 copper amine oxidase N-terminal domain-containing protein [Saccharibacillus sp. CPCC 101409]
MKKSLVKVAAVLMAILLLVPTLASAAPTTQGKAEDLRSALGGILGEHALLAVIAMQKGYDGKGDFAQSAAALGTNTDELTAAIASVYGSDAGAAFKPIWASHIGFFVDYVTAVKTGDAAGKQKALDNLDAYRVKQAKFFADANPNLSQSAIEAGLKVHIDHLLSAFDSYVAKNYTQAYSQADMAFKHMFMTGDAISGAIVKQFPSKFTGNLASPASNLRSALDSVLGEHAILAVWTMQKGIDGAPDFQNAAALLSKNTDELTAAVASVYGKDAGAAFKPIWASHIGFLVDYVTATSKKDTAGQQKAKDNLSDYIVKQAAFFAGANPNLPQAALESGLRMHIDQLLKAFDGYAAGSYAAVYPTAHEAYQHMFMFAGTLGEAIVKQFPAKFETATTTPPTTSMPNMPGMETQTIKLKVGSRTVTVDGKSMTMDVAPLVRNNTTYIPLRYLAESIGADLKYTASSKTVELMQGGSTVKFQIGKDAFWVDGTKRSLGAMAIVDHGRTQIPVRAVTQALGWTVGWKAATGDITLTKAQ